MSTRWQIDSSHSLLEFNVRHMMIARVRGQFDSFDGTVVADPQDLTTAQFEISADINSINTREPDRDAHLRSADFFDAENHPKMTFKSTRIEAKGDNKYDIHGELTIRGQTRPVTFAAEMTGEAKDPWGNERFGLTAESKINRKDWGLTWNAALETGGVLVGDEVRINVELELVKQQDN